MTSDQERLFAHLRTTGCDFRLLAHAPCRTMGDCLAVAEPLGAVYPKNVFLCNRAQSEFTLLLLEPGRRFVTREVSRMLGVSRLSFGPDERLRGFLHLPPGAVSPLGLLFESAKPLRFAVDDGLRQAERLCFHPLDASMTVLLPGEDFFGRFLPSVGREAQFLRLNEGENAP
ncbi:MAG: hypothetical protein LBD02_02410 [Christensenellaceae bacterium]|jgi:Ala-tRNA(Pro) deacylase|nr:hypothetical protein [Christensenellaceae bacterium]